MKYITFAIMAVLIFGVAASPVLTNGFAYGQTDGESEYTEKQLKENRSDESKQQKSEQRQAKDAEKRPVSEAKRTASEQLQEERRAELADRNRLLMEQLLDEERIDRERMQQRMDSMKDRGPMTEAMNRLNQANSSYLGNVGESNGESLSEALNSQRQNTNLDETGTYFDKLRETISEQKRLQYNLFSQITMLLNLVDSMCEDKVLVVGVSDGMLRCIDSDRAFNLHSRGLVTLVE